MGIVCLGIGAATAVSQWVLATELVRAVQVNVVPFQGVDVVGRCGVSMASILMRALGRTGSSESVCLFRCFHIRNPPIFSSKTREKSACVTSAIGSTALPIVALH